MTKLTQLVCIIPILLFITACDEQQKTQVKEPLRPVRTILASASDGIAGRDFPGIVIAENRADIAFRVSGKLNELLVKEGEKVVKGQVIARLDQTDFKIELKDKQATYDKSKANFTRSATLLEPGHISQREFDEIKAAYSTADAHLRAAKQNLIYTELKAPFDGSITKSYVDNFEEVMARDKIVTLQDLKSMQVEIDIPESLMINVKRSGEQRKIHATFDAIKDKKFPVIFREVSAQADETTHAYKIRFSLPPIENYTILPGMTATVVADKVAGVDGSGDESDITVPSHAVLEDNKGRFVYIAVPESASSMTGIIHRRNVTTSRLTNTGLIITSGLDPNDMIVIAGMSKMQEGMNVRLMVNPELIETKH
jgi:RND family efflux transporter MFP subunit